MASVTVEDLVQLFEDSESATLDARKLSERDRDYVDNKQLTSAQRAMLSKRGQPDDIFNHIKRRINFLVGVEKQQKVSPQALPNTPVHENDAQGATLALRYVAQDQDFDTKRSAVWRNMLVEGSGGMDVRVEPGYNSEMRIKLQRIAWDRMFCDPHSAETDFSDAAYLGTVAWMDYADALIKYPDGKDILDTTIASASPSDTYDDKPKFKVWADAKRKRVRVVQIWLKRGENWHWAEFTRGGILLGGPSPYRTDKGESDCGLIFQSAYVDRDNNRYGDVRELIGPQNEINKRRQKALHLLNTSQIIMRQGAVANVEVARREAARPDGVIEVQGNPADPLTNSFQFNTRTDLATGHISLLEQARREFDVMGVNATMLGDKTGDAASGKAIIASQQGGMMQLSDLLDNLRHFDVRVFRAIWYRIRQFWTAEKWFRVTDDERNIKWVGVNVDPMRMQMLQQSPEAAAGVAGTVSNIAELDCDINIDDAPDSLTPQLEQFQALVQLKQFDQQNELPFRALIAAAPNLKNKDQIFKQMDEASQANAQMRQMMQQVQMGQAQADVAQTQAGAQLKQAQAARTMQEIQNPPNVGAQPDHPATILADAEDKRASATLKHSQAMKTALEARLAPLEFIQKSREAERNAAINAFKARREASNANRT